MRYSSSRRRSGYLSCVFAVLALGGLSGPLGAQEPPQEVAIQSKLVAGDGEDGDNFGAAVATDGDVMVVAAPWADVGDAETSGAVYVFLRNAGSGDWIEHQQLLPASGDFGDNFYDLTLAMDGDTIVVGAPFTTLRSFQEGMVYVFQRDSGSGLWSEVARLSDESVDHGGHFGGSVALGGDLLVVGAPQDSSARNGLVVIFERNRGGANAWGRATTLTHAAANDAAHPKSFGSDVALQEDLLVIGASRTSVSWLYESDGAAYVFRRNETDQDRWDLVARLIVPGADQCVDGMNLSTFLVEASAEEKVAADACADTLSVDSGGFGHRVALDGDTVVVSARFADGEDGTYSVGKAYVFQRDPNATEHWPHVATLSPSLPSAGGYFGSTLALAGDTVMVGAPGTTVNTRMRQGAAYVFERMAGSPDAWGEVERLIAHDGLAEGQFGAAVALDGAARLVGAKGDDNYRGALYLQAAPEQPQGPAFEPTGELVDGGMVEGLAGVLLGAVGAGLTEPLPVWIHEVPAPEESLAEFGVSRGAYYNIGAVQTTVAAEGGAFVLALPVPEGETAHLTVAMRVSAERVLDGPLSGFVWLPMHGSYDPETRLFSVTLDTLLVEGSVVVLVEHPEPEAADPAPVPPDAEPVSLLRHVSDTPSSTTPPSVQFKVGCYEANADESTCAPADRQRYEQKLKEAYDYYRSLGFLKLNLRSETNADTNAIVYNDNWIKPPSLCDFGRSSYSMGFIMLCYDKEKTTDDEIIKHTRHELFHAFQNGSDLLHKNAMAANSDLEMDWILEGTASAAEGSSDRMMRRDDLPLHRIDLSLALFDGFQIEYEAQDFWVYFGMKKGLGLSYLLPLFERGGTTEAAAEFFAQDHQTSLGEEYWAWAKNQFMEKSFKIDAKLRDSCHVETNMFRKAQTLAYPPGDVAPVDGAPVNEASVEGVLDRLTSAVIKVTLREGAGPVRIKVDDVPSLKYKIYLDGESAPDENGKPRCIASVADNSPRTFEQPPPPENAIYVLISNTQHRPNTQIRYTVRAEPATADGGGQ